MIPSFLLTAIEERAQRVILLDMVLRDGGAQFFELGILELRAVALRYAAGGGQVGKLILDHGQILAGQAIAGLISHVVSLLFIGTQTVFPGFARIMRCFMENWKAKMYRLSLHALPRPAYTKENALIGDVPQKDEIVRALRSLRVVGATVAVFDEKGVTGALAVGQLGKGKSDALIDTVYRVASVTKHVTALCCYRLHEAGKINLDADVDAYLPCSLRHPKKPDLPVTLRRLISHTAGIHDGTLYNASLFKGEKLSQMMQGDSFTENPTAFEYSNLGAGIVACVLEGMLQKSFEEIMQETVFGPLKVRATFLPQKVEGELADAWRILPPSKQANYDAAARRAQPLPKLSVDTEHHYLWSQGNLCISAPDLAKIGVEMMKERYAPLRKMVAPFGARAYNLSMGLGTFIVEDKEICPQKVYGHQGLAYGAVHGLFYDPAAKKGVVVLTSGCSEARNGVLADLNKAMMKKVFQ